MASLGCGTHQAAVYDRDGARVCDLDVLVEIEWSRVLDDISEATAVVKPSRDCCACLAAIRTWRHKLVVSRDGVPVWEGPIVRIDWEADEITIQAFDILAWLERRVPHENHRFRDTDLTLIAQTLITDGFLPDDPGHSVEILAPAGIRGDRNYRQDDDYIAEHLFDLADTGLDLTTVGSTIVLMPEDHCERIGTLSDADFPDGLAVVEDGASLATRWVIWGDEDDNDRQVKGEAGGIDSYYRLLERIDDEDSIRDKSSADAAARARLRSSFPAPVFIDSQTATLSPDAPVDVSALVPGYCVAVTSTITCREISQTMKIMAVAVSEDDDGETVGVTIGPAGVGER